MNPGLDAAERVATAIANAFALWGAAAIFSVFIGVSLFVFRNRQALSAAGLLTGVVGAIQFFIAMIWGRFSGREYNLATRDLVTFLLGVALAAGVCGLIWAMASPTPRGRGFGWALAAQGLVLGLIDLQLYLALARA